MKKRLTPNDGMFLAMESREQMMHVAALMPFTPAPDTPPDHLRQLMNEIRTTHTVYPPWNLKLRTPDFLVNPLQQWVEDPKFDLDYHVRRSALPAPGDERELGIVVSRLHSHSIDFHRPPWEVHLVEGLERGRFALYVKVHHSLVDGYTSVRILERSLTKDPNERDRPLFISLPPPEREPSDDTALHFPALLAALREQLGSVRSVGKALIKVVQAAREKRRELIGPLQAPQSILNAHISRSRRFATQSLETERLRAVAKKFGGTLNDVVLAICAASLRHYLLDRNALPDKPLIAMLPVNIRGRSDKGGGNAVGAILASLATDLADPVERFATIIGSTRSAKAQLEGMSQSAMLQYSALLLSPFMLQMLPGTLGRIRPTFNLVISNVPGPAESLYFRGARLEAVYPMSIPVHGLALNITCNSYGGNIGFGFIGCRDTLPHLQRMAVYSREALAELEKI